MPKSIRLVSAAVAAVAAAALLAGPASAHPQRSAVFVQTDDPAGNTIVAYDRAPDGHLTQAGSYRTGGLGGVLDGSVVDHLASQGSLQLDHGLLYAVNAGSDTITVFAVDGDRLVRRQILPSFGDFPVSIATHGNHVYVLNARRGGSVQGYARARRRARADPAVASRARPGPERRARVHAHARAGRVHARRRPPAGHDQGQHERGHRV